MAYGSLLQEQRRILHARIVEAIEALYADRVVEQVERLAYHAQRGEVWDKALPYCRQAGAKAFARAALREAAAALEQALAALGHLPESRDTREQEIDLRLDLRTMLSHWENTSGSSHTCSKPKPSPRRWGTNGGWGRSPP